MPPRPAARLSAVLLAGALAACAGNQQSGDEVIRQQQAAQLGEDPAAERTSIFDLFSGGDNPNVRVEVNRYIWNAALDILDFMPIEQADPFTGVIVYGFGTPPGGGQAYRATVFVRDPALDARSLNVALVGRGGPVSAETQRAIEDAILTRARELRVRDSRL